jgi:hypothetical protein
MSKPLIADVSLIMVANGENKRYLWSNTLLRQDLEIGSLLRKTKN